MPSAAGPTIVLFLHPFCSCSDATFTELNQVLERRDPSRPAPVIDVLFVRYDPAWKPGEYWRDAEKLPGAHVRWDEDGKQARLFGATTSGFVLLYDARGQLRFHGGITGSRGHRGDNYGENRLLQALETPAGAPVLDLVSRVFGCAL
jgi:hypothetical protein